MHTLEPLLPLCLSLNGEPFDLEDHFPFSPLYRTRMPSQLVVVSGRQVSKSTSLAAHGVVMSNAVPFLKTLYITPLYEQIRRFSNNYVSSFINQSPVKALWTGSSTKNSVLSKTFRNNSSMTFSFTGTDCDRIRGLAVDVLSLDETQDLDSDHFPIIRETMSHSKWGLTKFTGTPKTLDNTIHRC